MSEASSSLAITARWTASARAQESTRDDRLFDDPFAADLAGPEGAEWLAQRGGNVAAMVIRTHYFDGFLQAAAGKHGIRQVVILAAGLDTRAYRLSWPEGTHLFELDQQPVFEHKQRVLQAAGAQPACWLKRIAVDLTGDWPPALLDSGFRTSAQSAWLLEGFLFYLPDTAIQRVLQQVSMLASPGSRIGFDIMNSLTLTSSLTRPWIEMQANAGAPWLGTLDDPEQAMATLGWKAAITQPGAPDANYTRWTLPVIPVKMPNMPHNWYVTAEKI